MVIKIITCLEMLWFALCRSEVVSVIIKPTNQLKITFLEVCLNFFIHFSHKIVNLVGYQKDLCLKNSFDSAFVLPAYNFCQKFIPSVNLYAFSFRAVCCLFYQVATCWSINRDSLSMSDFEDMVSS